MFCLVKLPDNINSKNRDLYSKSANYLYSKLNNLKNRIESVVAIGNEKNRSIWPGEKFVENYNFPAVMKGGDDNKKIIVIGLEAPFLSMETIEQFLSKCSQQLQNINSSAICTFREIPLQKNIAALEYGGKVFSTLTYLNKALTLSTGVCDSDLFKDAIDISINFPKSEVLIKSKNDLQFILSDIDQKNQQYWNSNTSDKSFSEKRLKYSKDENTYNITFLETCVVQLSEMIDSPGLYSKIQYGQKPITVCGLIGVNENQDRISLKTKKMITGRQSFPKLFEPFLGIAMIKQSEVIDLISKNDDWFKKQGKIEPVIINCKESKLINADTEFIISNWEKI